MVCHGFSSLSYISFSPLPPPSPLSSLPPLSFTLPLSPDEQDEFTKYREDLCDLGVSCLASESVMPLSWTLPEAQATASHLQILIFIYTF